MKRDQPETTAAPVESAKETQLEGDQKKIQQDEINEVLNKVTGIEFVLGEFVCGICQKEMSKSVKILCAECGLQICLECFANGKEKGTHLKSHDYFVLDRLTTPIYDPAWTAFEEFTLIKGIEKFGIDNWVEISDFLATKTPQECETHYYAFYYRSPAQKVPTPDLIVSEQSSAGFNLLPERVALAEQALSQAAEKLKEKCSESPAPEQVTSESEPAPGDVIGYMPLRGDFNVEYDNDAELILAEMEFTEEDKKADLDLKYEVLRTYNSKLDERIRRKKFVIDNDLTDPKSILQQEMSLSKEKREAYALLRPFRRFCVGDEHERLAEGLLEEIYLKQRIEELKKFKAMGLDTFEKIRKYLNDNKKGLSYETPVKEKAEEDTPMELSKEEEEVKDVTEREENEAQPNEQIKEIRKAEGYSDLTAEEQAFCEGNLLFPRVYQQFKAKLQQKAAKVKKSMRRVTALEFADKIVNKNKALLIFDFLTSKNLLHQTP